MVIYLRDNDNKTLFEAELSVVGDNNTGYVELSASVGIENYSRLLLSNERSSSNDELIDDFEFLSELRGWLWESFFVNTKNSAADYDNVLVLVRRLLDDIGANHGLHRVED